VTLAENQTKMYVNEDELINELQLPRIDRSDETTMSKGHKKIDKDLTGRFIRVGRDRSTVTLDDRPRWRILVPVADNDCLVFTAGHRKKFDGRVLKISGGSTENHWSQGKWIYKRRLCSEPMVPFEFHATTEQAFEIAAFARGHFNQEEVELSLMPGPVYRIRRAEQAKPSKLARVRKAIWRRIGRIGRGLFAVLQGSREDRLEAL